MKYTLALISMFISSAAFSADYNRITTCVNMQVLFLQYLERGSKIENVINLAQPVDMNKKKMRENYEKFVEIALNQSFGQGIFTNCQINDLKCYNKEFDWRISKLENDPLWNYYGCTIVAPRSKPSYDDLVDEVDELKDRIRQLENE